MMNNRKILAGMLVLLALLVLPAAVLLAGNSTPPFPYRHNQSPTQSPSPADDLTIEWVGKFGDMLSKIASVVPDIPIPTLVTPQPKTNEFPTSNSDESGNKVLPQATRSTTRTVFLPIIIKSPSFPSHTTSYYMESTNPDFLEQIGCKASQGPDGIVILFFGDPAYDSQNEKYGTRLHTSASFASTSTIEAAMKKWVEGFIRCGKGSGIGIVGVGTSNHGDYLSTEHGKEWGLMINRLTNFIRDRGYGAYIAVKGANNIELNFGTPTKTRRWVNGYVSVTNIPFYNVGACEGCAYGSQTHTGGDNGWEYDDIWRVHYSDSIRSLPQVYAACCSASQWQKFASWIYNNYPNLPYSNIEFEGTMTQYWACQDKKEIPGQACAPGTDNMPSDGWLQLFTELNN